MRNTNFRCLKTKTTWQALREKTQVILTRINNSEVEKGYLDLLTELVKRSLKGF